MTNNRARVHDLTALIEEGKERAKAERRRPNPDYRTATHYTLPDGMYKGNYACLNGSYHLKRTDIPEEVNCVACLEAMKERIKA